MSRKPSTQSGTKDCLSNYITKASQPESGIYILNNWYTCSVLQCGNHSRPFPTLQGVCQGAILSPLLYCIFVDDLLSTLELSGLGVRIGEVFYGAPMYANDLALVASSPEEQQAMLDIVSRYIS